MKISAKLRPLDLKIIHFFRRFAVPMARLSLFIVFTWFGALKVIGLSPASGLVQRLFETTIPWMSFGTFIVLFGLFEVLIGILFLIRGAERIVIPLLAVHMVTTFGPLVFLPQETWTGFMVPTLEGQYIIKNFALIAAAMGIAAHLHPLRKGGTESSYDTSYNYNNRNTRAFTLTEMLIVIAIIAVLSSIVLSGLNVARNKAYYSRAMEEFKTLSTALETYSEVNNGDYPPDVSRDVPAGLEPYLSGGVGAGWPDAPWPGSVYDWDNWNDPSNPGQRIYQISIRFCPPGGALSTCKFPKESWAANFGVNSAVYWCISGACRAHESESPSYPGYCVNCDMP